ncbi:MAG: phytoene desaturase family protein, partial [candidate division KSB1 bacterium]|nr:phytoene desaturase family protein [candidate division KSB1 bacterium]
MKIISKKQIVVVGGGLGGLTAAIRLAHQGHRVQLFEKNETLGGKMNQWIADGFRFDTGPSLLTMPFVIDELFDSIGEKRSDYLEFVPIDPICRYFWQDGSTLDATADTSRMISEMRKFSEDDAKRYELFLAYTKRIYDITADVFLFTPMHEIKKLAKWKTFLKLFRAPQIDPFRTVHQGVSRFFKHPKLVQLFDRYATYNGSNPYQAPATLNIIPYVEYGLGCYYIKGGMYRLVEVLKNVAEKVGVKIHTDANVEKILHQHHRIQGIHVNGEKILADVVISNADVVVAFDELIEGFPKQQAKLKRLKPSLSGIVFLWGIDRQHSQLAQHNIIFAEDYELEFKQIFEDRKVPDDPTIYIAITSKLDPDHAPAGGENWFVLVNVPYLADGQNWQSEIPRLKKVILEKLERLGISVADHIRVEKVITPQDFYD